MRKPVALLAAAVLLSAPAAGAATRPARPARSATPATRAGRAAAWFDAKQRHVRHLPVDPGLLAAQRGAAVASDSSAYLLDAGDLDGDGSHDFADVRSTYTDDPVTGFAEKDRIEVHAGRDGHLLWSATLTDNAYNLPLFVKTGTGKPGIVVVSYASVSDGAIVAGGWVDTLTATSYDGAGTTLWTARDAGGGAGALVAGAWARETYVDGVFDAVPGGGADFLIEADDGEDSIAAPVTNQQLSILDGSTGTAAALGKPYVDAGYGGLFGTGPDTNRDHRDDVLMLSYATGSPTMSAVSAADGTALWSAAMPEADDYSMVPVADSTGDGVDDVLVYADRYGGGRGIVVDSVSGSSVVLYDGATGKLRWERAGYKAFTVGNADGRKGAEIAVVNSLPGGVDVTLMTASGKARWHAIRKVKVNDLKRYDSTLDAGSVGDVDSDGVVDVGYLVDVLPLGAKERRDAGMFNGRTGRVTRDPAKDLYGTKVAIDGHGADGYARTYARGALTMTAWRGNAPTRLWTTSVPVPDVAAIYRAFGTYADRDACGDLVVELTGETEVAVAISGATGRPLWSLTRDGDATAVVKKAPRSTTRTFVKTC